MALTGQSNNASLSALTKSCREGIVNSLGQMLGTDGFYLLATDPNAQEKVQANHPASPGRSRLTPWSSWLGPGPRGNMYSVRRLSEDNFKGS